jgi:3-phenylpropionate/trans-cinnamate dioxygenase ferredoxin subunit
MPKFAVARESEIADGSRLIVEVAGRSIGIFNVGGAFYALRNRCPHNGGPLCEGGPVYSLVDAEKPGAYRVDDSRKFVACPWHGWEYDIETGQSWFDPVRSRVRAYAVSVVSGDELSSAESPIEETERVKGPYIAETYQVAVTDSLVVVDIPR